MAKNKHGVSGLLSSLTTQKITGLNVSDSLKPTTLSGASSSSTARVSKPPSLGDIKTLSMSGKDTAVGINFGKPSNSRTSTTKTSNTLTTLLTRSASGGVASVLSGGLSSIAGLGGLFSGISSLFGGGKSTPPPLADFQLPNSVSQTLYVSSQGSTGYQGTVVEKPSTSGPSGNQTLSAQQLQYQSAAIAQAVKTAILKSSSLNDVIAEI